MIHNAADEDLRLGDDYVKLENGGGDDGGVRWQAETSTSGCCGGSGVGGVNGGWWWSWWWWAKLVLVVLFVGVLGAVFFKWVGPFFMDKEIIPIIIWERKTFSTTMLALIVFGSLTIFPSLLIPSTPSMWVAGMTFGYGYGFLLIIGGVAFGVTIPYFVGSLFCHRIHAWLERYPKKASIIRLAGEGNWFNQFRAVTLIRISPFPYVIYNYCAMATDVKYGPYLLGTLVGIVPEIFVALYTGILIKTLANASHDRHSLSALQIVFNVIGFCITVATTVIVTLYAKRRLKELQMQEELLLQ
ncbi:hypothetical protein DH2020_028579 [Rehmannia glutinosa]|uniref:VTT domain-containing protein n=1 Tax=Rehmannia glutinosa TaxID=99300 RepID=A0ABR0VQZ0_REHGL